jgi:hypothetical protein
MNIGKIYLLAYLSISSTFGASFIDLANNQTFINEQFIHQVVQDEMVTGNLSTETLKLLRDNRLLIESVDESSNLLTQQSKCEEIDTNDSTDPKKKKTKTRTKKSHGWVIESSTSFTSAIRKPEYRELVSNLAQSDYNDFYVQLRNAQSATDLQDLVRQQTQGMNEDEYFSYLSEMTVRLPYNNAKANFDQNEQGVDDFFSQLSEDRQVMDGTSDLENWGGICGDIHFATALMGEAARPGQYEYFTASYVIQGGQHVNAFAVSKEDPNKAFVVNYSKAAMVNDINGAESLVPQNSINGAFDNIGANVRIFKNSSDSPSGQAEHVATLPTALGRYIEQAHTRDHQRANFGPNTAGITNQLDFRQLSTIEKENGDKKKSINVGKGIKLLQGTIQGVGQSPTNVFSVLVYKERMINTTGNGFAIDPDKIMRESNTSLSSTFVSSATGSNNETSIVTRFNAYEGIHKVLVPSDKVKIQLNTGYNFNVDMITRNSEFTGDVNIQPFVGFDTQIKTGKTSQVSTTFKATGAIGLKEERLVFDGKATPSNLKMTTNVIEAQAKYEEIFTNNNTFSVGAGVVSTQVGGFYNAFSSYQISATKSGTQHIVTIDYTKPTKGFNKDIAANLLPVNEQASLMYGVNKGNFNVSGALIYDFKNTNVQAALNAKINIFNQSKNRKKKRSPSSK